MPHSLLWEGGNAVGEMCDGRIEARSGRAGRFVVGGRLGIVAILEGLCIVICRSTSSCTSGPCRLTAI